MTVIIQKESEENQELIGACADLKTEGNSFFFRGYPADFRRKIGGRDF